MRLREHAPRAVHGVREAHRAESLAAGRRGGRPRLGQGNAMVTPSVHEARGHNRPAGRLAGLRSAGPGRPGDAESVGQGSCAACQRECVDRQARHPKPGTRLSVLRRCAREPEAAGRGGLHGGRARARHHSAGARPARREGQAAGASCECCECCECRGWRQQLGSHAALSEQRVERRDGARGRAAHAEHAARGSAPPGHGLELCRLRRGRASSRRCKAQSAVAAHRR